MKIYTNIDKFKVNNTILTIGTFDGVHRGHLKILKHLKKTAKQFGGESVVLTFNPHPRYLLFPKEKSLKLLNSFEEKINLLDKIGIKHLIVLPFTKEFSQFDSCYFIENILFKKLNVKHLVVGYDHQFGKDRQGNIDILRKYAKPFGFDIEKVTAIKEDKINISSTKIRNLLKIGNIKKANKYLGYNFFISGKIVRGNGLGRLIDFPTANIIIADKNKIIPQKGVYAVKIKHLETIYYGMLNIGNRPTFGNSTKKTIEVNIFDFNKQIYDCELKIYFEYYIRKEIKFENIMELKKQLIKDKKNVCYKRSIILNK